MEKVLIVSAVIVAILLLVFTGIAGYFYFVIFGNNDRTLARNLAVSSEWTEIKIDPPAKPAYNHQAIYIRPVNFEVNRAARSFEVRLPDGQIVEPQIEIYDENGNKFEMHKVGFAMGSSDYVEFWPGTKNDTTGLPSDRKYTLVRIRSDVPFDCERVNWIDYSPP